MKTTKIIKTAIIGGGASGLMLAVALGAGAVIFERGERVGRKLSATGNGQGNITNLAVKESEYFSSSDTGKIQNIIRAYDDRSLTAFFASLGVLLSADERGRVYPTGRQASALTDALRFALDRAGVETRLQTTVRQVEKQDGLFKIVDQDGKIYYAETLALCAGGKAAKNFGTDGNAYAIAQRFGHTVTPLYPSLVQLKTDTTHTKTLKGIRVSDAGLCADWKTGSHALLGDVIFTDYGISGDATFRLSAFIADKRVDDVTLTIDFLPAFSRETILNALYQKRGLVPDSELLCGIVNNQVGRAVLKRAEGDIERAATLVKAFPLVWKGSLGFDYAQVTKGGVRLRETDENLQSLKTDGLYFAGEILDVDGQCGGFNLQWAYSSARAVATAITVKTRGQV